MLLPPPARFGSGTRFRQGIHILGHQFLSRGAILTGLIWGAMTALLIDNRFLGATGFALAALVLALFGFIHAPHPGIHHDLPLVWSYGLIALIFAATHAFRRRQRRP